MKEVINRQLVNSAIRHHASLRLTYINNAKVGTGNIKAAMWAQVDRNTGRSTLGRRSPHDRANSPFVPHVFKTDQYDFDHFVDTPLFTVVRNPFARILSAYLSKIVRPLSKPKNHAPAWTTLCKRHQIDSELLTFKDFLNIIASDQAEFLDPHFRPQYINILYPFIPFTYVGKLEQMHDVHTLMAANGIEPVAYNRNRTDANERLSAYYDGDCERLVQKIYEDDFRAFGYKPELAHVNDVAAVPEREPVSHRLAKFVRAKGRGMPATPSWETAVKDIRAATSLAR